MQPWQYFVLIISSNSPSVNSPSLYDEFFAFLQSLKPPLDTRKHVAFENKLYNLQVTTWVIGSFDKCHQISSNLHVMLTKKSMISFANSTMGS